MTTKIRIKNKKVLREYELEERFVAGVQLVGTEIKSIRAGKATLVDSFCFFQNKELYVRGLHVAEYIMGTHWNHNPTRVRKLLLNKRELQKLDKKVREKGYTIVAVVLFVNERGLAKLEIALARGRKTFDKREDIKRKDLTREMERKFK
ncbi:MAG: SsrA-binding protein SmpB [Bacteroidetes bacterium]|jgi:SsrA-binding protein|nr:SsrA-binding protein SmpB [Bacteroidota bacterium]MBT7941510.1 SsrA-binding protein SmpB [Candidatus Neomarinimicrobiota bacterium]MBT3748312.1 SsrA-binding protein SmpB [Bacteroidota bacterium]MBT4411591.1 SsrA-binding protein SmpB [Bacteroidota bacterium]MBT5425928.1 SsrA-binding protein SmpB [Bacteroidota bacterium]